MIIPVNVETRHLWNNMSVAKHVVGLGAGAKPVNNVSGTGSSPAVFSLDDLYLLHCTLSNVLRESPLAIYMMHARLHKLPHF